MTAKKTHKAITIFIALVWFINGFFCKVLHLVPRHEAIVARIVTESYARELTFLIGISEIVMSIWVVKNYQTKRVAILQITLVAIMNILEFLLVPDLLLWGKLNALFAFIFIGIIYYNTFILPKKVESCIG